MLRKLLSSALAVTGCLIGLGAFGHSFVGRKALDAGLARVPLDAHTDQLIHLIWYFCGGCMLVFGALVAWSAWQSLRAKPGALVVAGAIGIFYLLTGLLALAYMHEPFWAVFVVLGGLTLLLAVALSRPQPVG